MKMSRLKIISILLIGVVSISIGGLVYVLKTKINEDEIRILAIDKIKEVFPKAKVKLGKVKIGVGINVSLSVDKFSLNLPARQKSIEMISVDDLSFKIPILSILMGGGDIEIILDKPQLTYIEMGDKSNWQLAMKSTDLAKPQLKSKKVTSDYNKINQRKNTESKSILMPAFIANSSIDLKLNEVLVNYDLDNGKEGRVFIKKFVMKNLGFENLAAYELVSKMNFSLAKDDNISLEILLIGQFSLKDFLEKGDLLSKAHLKLSHFSFSQHPYQLPNIKSDIDFKLHRDGKLQGKLGSELVNSSLSLNFSMDKGNVHLSKIKAKLYLKELLSILNNPELSSHSDKSALHLNGILAIEKGLLHPQVNFSITPDLPIVFNGIKSLAKANGSLKGSRFRVKTRVKIFSGEVESSLLGDFNLNNQNPFHKKLKNYKLKINANGIVLNETFLRKTIYGKKVKKPSPEKEGISQTSKETRSNAFLLLPKGKVSLYWKNIKVGDQDFNGGGEWSTHFSTIRTSLVNFQYGKGKGKLFHVSKMYKDRVDNRFDLKMTRLNLDGLNGLLPEQISEVKGTATGRVGGTISTGKVLKYDLDVKLNASQGELKGIDIKGYTEAAFKAVSKIPVLKDKIDPNKKIDVDGNFEKLFLLGKFKQDHYKLSKFSFWGIKKMIEIQARGNIYPNPKGKEGVVYADIKEFKTISPQLKKYTSTDAFPVRLKGYGLFLKPDYSYSIKKIAELGLAKKKKALTKKAKDEAKDKLKNLLKGKGKKLLKGLF